MKTNSQFPTPNSRRGFTPLETPAKAVKYNLKSKPRRNSKFLTGFTLIELLVVVAIIGLLSSIISVSLNTSRTRARDARRVTDLKQIKSGLDLYFSTGSGYPDKAVWDATVGQNLACSGVPALTIPKDPLSPTYGYVFTGTGSSRTGCGGTVWSNYTLEFYIENKAKYYIMNEDGNLTDKATGAVVSFDTLL